MRIKYNVKHLIEHLINADVEWHRSLELGGTRATEVRLGAREAVILT